MKRFLAYMIIIGLNITLCAPLSSAITKEALPVTKEALPLTKQALPIIQSQGAIIVEQNSGKILFNKSLHQRFYPASTTKILTALIAIEKGNLKDVVTVGKEINLLSKDSSKAGLYVGQRISLKNLIYGLMLPSGNDAANTIAVYIGRKASGNRGLTQEQAIKYFVKLMNQRGKALGAKDSNFLNPHGYHNPKHYTSVYDLSLITKKAFSYPFFREVVKTPAYTIVLNSKTKRKVTWYNRNDLIQSKNKHYYPYATGIKTGHTSSAGYCLVSSATKDGHGLLVIVMKSTLEGQWSDTKKLYNYGFTK